MIDFLYISYFDMLSGGIENNYRNIFLQAICFGTILCLFELLDLYYILCGLL